MMARCPFCDAELGPGEDPAGCLTCQGRSLRTNPDWAVAMLEEVSGPIAVWDVRRLLGQAGKHVGPGSLQVWLSADYRTCWAGPSIYGLYRHGLLPGVRDMGSAAVVYLAAADSVLTQDEIYFVLRHVGYRDQSTSMYLALRRMADFGLIDYGYEGWTWAGKPLAPIVGLEDFPDEVDAVFQRAVAQVSMALEERERRLD